jgi:hypothetical protein
MSVLSGTAYQHDKQQTHSLLDQAPVGVAKPPSEYEVKTSQWRDSGQTTVGSTVRHDAMWATLPLSAPHETVCSGQLLHVSFRNRDLSHSCTCHCSSHCLSLTTIYSIVTSCIVAIKRSPRGWTWSSSSDRTSHQNLRVNVRPWACTDIPQQEDVKYLELHLYRRLTWRKHIFTRMVSSGMLHLVALVRTDVSEEPSASFIKVIRIGELGTTLAATSNRRTLRRKASVLTRVTRCNIPECTILHSHRGENLKSYTCSQNGSNCETRSPSCIGYLDGSQNHPHETKFSYTKQNSNRLDEWITNVGYG